MIPSSVKEYQDLIFQFQVSSTLSKNRIRPLFSVVALRFVSVWFPVKQHVFPWVFGEYFLFLRKDVHDQ